MGTTYWWRFFLVLAATSIGSGAFPAAQGCRSRGWEQPTFPLGFAIGCVHGSLLQDYFVSGRGLVHFCVCWWEGNSWFAPVAGEAREDGSSSSRPPIEISPLCMRFSHETSCSVAPSTSSSFLQPQSLMAIVHCECFLMQSQSKDML